MLTEQTEDWQFRVGEWEQLAITYESLARQIARLLLSNGGVTQYMSDVDYAGFRQLAMRRDLTSHTLRMLEYNLLNE